MKSIINHPVFRVVVFGLIFLLSSVTLFYDYKLATSFISPSYRGFVYFLPTFLCLLLPSISMVFYYCYIHNFNVKKQWKILIAYVVIMGIASLLSLIGSIIVASVGKFELISLNSTFPFGTIALSAVYLASVVMVCIYISINKNDYKVPQTVHKRAGFRKSIIGLVLLVFAAFFFGDFLTIFNLIKKPYDENLPLMIPIFMTFLYGTIEVVLYVIYKNIKNFDRQFMFYKNSLFAFTIFYLFLNTFVVAVIMVNLRIFEQSMMEYIPSQGYLGFPIGVLATVIIPLGPIVYSCVRFGVAKNEQKQKENIN